MYARVCGLIADVNFDIMLVVWIVRASVGSTGTFD